MIVKTSKDNNMLSRLMITGKLITWEVTIWWTRNTCKVIPDINRILTSTYKINSNGKITTKKPTNKWFNNKIKWWVAQDKWLVISDKLKIKLSKMPAKISSKKFKHLRALIKTTKLVSQIIKHRSLKPRAKQPIKKSLKVKMKRKLRLKHKLTKIKKRNLLKTIILLLKIQLKKTRKIHKLTMITILKHKMKQLRRMLICRNECIDLQRGWSN